MKNQNLNSKKVIQYDNGLRVIVDTIAGLKSVSSGIWVGVGSAKESPKINGLSHFAEHMFFKGTDKLSPFEVADSFESLGASVNAFTGKGATCYYIKSIDENFDKCFYNLTHIFFDSTFEPSELNKERKVIVEEINMVEDAPDEICFDLISKAMYGTSALGQTILGSIDNVKRFSQKDVRDFVKKFYCASNTVISFAGAIDLDTADKLVRKYVLPKICTNVSSEKEPSKLDITRTHLERIKDFEQSNIVVSFESLEFNSPFSAIQNVLNVIAGGGMSSRLFQRVREQLGLAYSVYTGSSGHINNGSFNVILNISPENTTKALSAVFEELKGIKSGNITKQEVERAKIQLKSSLIFGRENVSSVMIANGRMLLLANEVYDIEKRIAEIDAVTVLDTNVFANKIFTPQKMCSAYVGRKHGARFEEFAF